VFDSYCLEARSPSARSLVHASEQPHPLTRHISAPLPFQGNHSQQSATDVSKVSNPQFISSDHQRVCSPCKPSLSPLSETCSHSQREPVCDRLRNGFQNSSPKKHIHPPPHIPWSISPARRAALLAAHSVSPHRPARKQLHTPLATHRPHSNHGPSLKHSSCPPRSKVTPARSYPPHRVQSTPASRGTAHKACAPQQRERSQPDHVQTAYLSLASRQDAGAGPQVRPPTHIKFNAPTALSRLEHSDLLVAHTPRSSTLQCAKSTRPQQVLHGHFRQQTPQAPHGDPQSISSLPSLCAGQIASASQRKSHSYTSQLGHPQTICAPSYSEGPLLSDELRAPSTARCSSQATQSHVHCAAEPQGFAAVTQDRRERVPSEGSQIGGCRRSEPRSSHHHYLRHTRPRSLSPSALDPVRAAPLRNHSVPQNLEWCSGTAMVQSSRQGDLSSSRTHRDAREWDSGGEDTAERRQGAQGDTPLFRDPGQDDGQVGRGPVDTGAAVGMRSLSSEASPQHVHVHIHSYDQPSSARRCATYGRLQCLFVG
jgi:hypothetical protein